MKPTIQKFFTKWARIGLGIIISLGALYLALRGVDLRFVWETIKGANWGCVALALLCVAFNILGKTMRWRLLVGPSGRDIGMNIYLKVLLASQMLNTIFPARLGDLALSFLVLNKPLD